MKWSLRLLLAFFTFTAASASTPKPPIATVPHVELPRFMGRWYVIAVIPTFAERNAFGSVESYALNPDGTVATTFTFHRGALDGPLKTMKPRGFVRDAGNATWGMQFLWPFKAQYLIAYLNPEYTETVIARDKRDYVWIMARTPQLPPERYQHLVEVVKDLGYDLSKLQRVPQAAEHGG